ncbi:MAG: hypothetical protein LBI92_06475 [Azoarcus sp.]|nr:hypothetical protein [Azoarcus sp.]
MEHSHVTIRNLARDILDQALRHPDELAHLSSALQEQVRRLHQQAHFPEDGSGGGSSSPDEPGQYISSTAPIFPKSTPEIPETVRTVNNKVDKVPTYRTPPAETPRLDASVRFRQLAVDQQDCLSGRLRALPPEQRRDVLAEWNVRCAAGAVRDAAAYLFGLIRKAIQGTFRLWAARKNIEISRVQETPRKPLKPPSTAEPPVPEPAGPPASREVAWAHLQRIQALLQGTSSAAPVRATKPTERRHPPAPLARALAQAMPSTGQLRPLTVFLTPVMETGR